MCSILIVMDPVKMHNEVNNLEILRAVTEFVTHIVLMIE
jgi:hypothetical protein